MIFIQPSVSLLSVKPVTKGHSLWKCQLWGKGRGRELQAPAFTLASNLDLIYFIYITFLHMSFEEKATSTAKRVQLENHCFWTIIQITGGFISRHIHSSHKFRRTEMRDSPAQRRLGVPWGRHCAPVPFIPICCTQGTRPTLSNVHSMKKCQNRHSQGSPGVQSHKDHKHSWEQTPLRNTSPESHRALWNLPWFSH